MKTLQFWKYGHSLREISRFDNRWQILFERLFCRATAVQIYRLGRLHMLVDNRASDAGSIRQCLAKTMYSQFLDRISLDTVHHVLDVGANVGGFSLLLMSLRVPIDTLTCVELNPNTFERLRFNIMTNFREVSGNGATALVLNAAACRLEGDISVMLGRGSTADSIAGTRQTNASTKSVFVKGMTLDSLADQMFSGRTIDLCKMDIEGAEEEVILDPRSGNAVLGRIRYLLIEIHHERSALDIVSRLCSFGLNRVAGEHDDTNLGVSLFVNRSLAPAHRRSVSVRESEHRS